MLILWFWHGFQAFWLLLGQVKLMFEAPDPTVEEIWVFRQSVQERVALLESAPELQFASFRHFLDPKSYRKCHV